MSIQTILDAASSLYPLITKELSDQNGKVFGPKSWSLTELDEWKRAQLPLILKDRLADHDLHLTKEELALLMDWKLAKGKFRPTLPKLIQSNDEDAVKQVTQTGLKMFMDFASPLKEQRWNTLAFPEYQQAIKDSLKKVCELRGVGPATGSLILSLLSECTAFAAPFFSDESFMYYVQEPMKPNTPIKYNVKEYTEEYVGVLFGILQENPKSSMNELENGGWALKIYYENRIAKLSTVKLPFKVDDSIMKEFSSASKYMPIVEKKRKSTTIRPAKRAKKSN